MSMDENMYQYLLNSLEHSSRSVFYYRKKERKAFYANKQALLLFSGNDGVVDVYNIFDNKEAPGFLRELVSEQIQEMGYSILHDIPVITSTGNSTICDVQVAYVDEEQEVLSIELNIKQDNRMAEEKNEIDSSPRAVAILNLDDDFSIYYCNKTFADVFQKPGPSGQSYEFDRKVASTFLPEKKVEICQKIKKELQISGVSLQNIEIFNSDGEIKWYSLELRSKKLDNHGEKALALLTNIENIVKVEEELEEINQYFDILQSMCKGLLYRFDIHTRTLYRNAETAKLYKVPTVAHNFPEKEWLAEVMHPEDVKEFVTFIDTIVSGKEGSHTARLRTPERVLEYHKFTFKPIFTPEGTIKEMVGCATNVHNLKETEKELEEVNQYFQIIQTMLQGMLYRFDIKNRILYRNKPNAHSFALPSVGENYPDLENLKKVIHPSDLDSYISFIQSVLQGKEGSIDSKVRTATGEFQYHNMTFKALRNQDGSIREMIGFGKNIHQFKKTEEDLARINRHFDGLQELSDDLLFRIHIENKILTHCGKKVNLFGLNQAEVSFPDDVYKGGAIHPDDHEIYEEFAQKVFSGEGGTAKLRMRERKEEDYCGYQLTWLPIEDGEGNIREVVGKLKNIQKKLKLQREN